MAKFTITKHLLRDLKECRTIAINFDDNFSDMRIIAEDRESTYALEASNSESTWQKGFWYTYNSDFNAIINNLSDEITIIFRETAIILTQKTDNLTKTYLLATQNIEE